MRNEREGCTLETKTVRGAGDGDPATGAVSVPIYQSATFRHPRLGESTGWDYSRVANPTRSALEEHLSLLEGAQATLAFSSGMAAVAAVMDLLSSGDHVLLSEDLYGGTYRIFDLLGRARGIAADFVDTSKVDLVRAAFRPDTKLLLVETPSNPLMRISDIAALAELARAKGALLAVDNTFLSPYFQRPLALGAHLSIHSGTKFLAGHNDTLSGFVCSSDAALSERLDLVRMTTGAVLAPFDSWLVQRGLKTLALRLEKQQANAAFLAERLASHPAVKAVYYPGLPGHPGRDLNARQASGAGGMLSFAVRDAAFVPRILENLGLVLFAESLGGVESLITYPMTQTHASIPAEYRERLGVDESLLRLSVGIEDAGDLWTDLSAALGKAAGGN